MVTKCKTIAVMILVLAVSAMIAIPASAGWDLYVGCYGDYNSSYPVYPNGVIARFDGLTGAFKPGTWNPGQPNQQTKPECLFAEANANRFFQALVKPDGTVHAVGFAWAGIQTYDQNGNQVIQNAAFNPPNMFYQTSYGGSAKMIWTDTYAFVVGRYLPDSTSGGVSQFELSPATKPAAPLNPWYAEAPFGVAGVEPYSFEILPDGRFLVLDSRGHFYWFAADGTYLTKQQIWVTGDPVLEAYPGDIAYHDGYMYVTLSKNETGEGHVKRWQVQPEGTDWVVDETWDISGTLPNSPWGLAFGPDGNLYLTPRSDDKVVKYNGVTGAYIGDFTTVSQYAHYPRYLTFVETGGGGGGVTGTVTLKDWSGVTAGVAAVIELRDGTGATVETKNVTLASDGGFNFTTSLNGSYTAVAKSGHWLAKAMPLNITGGSGSVSFELTNGDCNGDNGVDEIDYALLSNAWYQALGDPAYNPVADLNGDGGVDEIDYAILSNAWYTAGD